MPFLVANAPVRGGRVYALRSRAAVFDAPRTGRSMPTLKRFGRILGESVFILRVQVFGRAPEGKRNDGGKKAVTVEYRPDIVALMSDVMDWGSTLLEHLYFVYKRWESIGSVLAFKRSSSGQFGSPERSEFAAHVALHLERKTGTIYSHVLCPCPTILYFLHARQKRVSYNHGLCMTCTYLSSQRVALRCMHLLEYSEYRSFDPLVTLIYYYYLLRYNICYMTKSNRQPTAT